MVTTASAATSRNYEGAFEYAGDTLVLMHTPEGVVEKLSPGFRYSYYLKDHLGNTRAVVTGTKAQPLLSQTSDYYPFGMSFDSNYGDDIKYLYNGKEIQEELGLDWYDYGARFYDPQIGRWHAIDLLAETLQESLTPYHYCLNNPILHTDPDGRIPPLIVAGLIFAGKAIAGALIDGGTQYTVNRAQGMSHSDAMNNLDYTSMGASAIIGGATAPGVSTTLKTTLTVGAIATDALIDVSNNQTQTAFGVGGTQEKSLTNIALDATFGAIGTKASDGIVDGSKRSVANDLKPSNYAPLDAEGKQAVRTTETVVNSGAFEQTVNAATSVTVGNSGVINSSIKTNTGSQSTSQTTSNKPVGGFVQPVYTAPSDNTRVVLPIDFNKFKNEK